MIVASCFLFLSRFSDKDLTFIIFILDTQILDLVGVGDFLISLWLLFIFLNIMIHCEIKPGRQEEFRKLFLKIHGEHFILLSVDEAIQCQLFNPFGIMKNEVTKRDFCASIMLKISL